MHHFKMWSFILLIIFLRTVHADVNASYFKQVDSEYSVSKTARMLQKMERFLDESSKKMKMDYRTVEPPKLVILEEKKSFFEWIRQHPEYIGAKYSGGFYHPGEKLILLFGEDPDKILSKSFHELMHFLVGNRFKKMPKLLEEGLCAYVETADIKVNSVQFGKIHSGYLGLYQRRPVPINEDRLRSLLGIKTYGMGTREETFGSPEYSLGWAVIWSAFHFSEKYTHQMQTYLGTLTREADPSGQLFMQMVGDTIVLPEVDTWLREQKRDPKNNIDFWLK